MEKIEITKKQSEEIHQYLTGESLKYFLGIIKLHSKIAEAWEDSFMGVIELKFKGDENLVLATPFWDRFKGIPIGFGENSENYAEIKTDKNEFNDAKEFANWYYGNIDEIYNLTHKNEIKFV